MQQYDRAVERYRRALRLFQEAGDEEGVMQTCNLLGVVERKQGRLAIALYIRIWTFLPLPVQNGSQFPAAVSEMVDEIQMIDERSQGHAVSCFLVFLVATSDPPLAKPQWRTALIGLEDVSRAAPFFSASVEMIHVR